MILLKRKRDLLKEIKKHKCRLVMNGSEAVNGKDLFNTYAPVIDHSSVRLLISLAFGNGWEMRLCCDSGIFMLCLLMLFLKNQLMFYFQIICQMI